MQAAKATLSTPRRLAAGRTPLTVESVLLFLLTLRFWALHSERLVFAAISFTTLSTTQYRNSQNINQSFQSSSDWVLQLSCPTTLLFFLSIKPILVIDRCQHCTTQPHSYTPTRANPARWACLNSSPGPGEHLLRSLGLLPCRASLLAWPALTKVSCYLHIEQTGRRLHERSRSRNMSCM